MRTISAHHAKQNFGDMLRLTKSGPVAIERYSRIAAVVISADEYRRYQSMIDHRRRRDVSNLLHVMEDTRGGAEYHRTSRKLRRVLNDNLAARKNRLT